MNKEKILQTLKTIKYPGFNRDIVSFGMIKDIVILEEGLEIKLNISSQNEDKKQLVVKEIKKHLQQDFSSIKIDLINDTKQKSIATNTIQEKPILGEVNHIIAIGSGKGGVGKSTVAANLACALSAKGKKVGLLDLDIYGPSLPIIFDLNIQPKMTQDNKLIPLEKFGIKVMSFGFISGNDTPVIWRGPLVSRMTEQFFRDVEWGSLDILILDLPPGTGDIQLTLTQKLRMTGAIIVTTPQDIALADVRKGADMFKKVNTPLIGVVENMSGLLLTGETDSKNSNILINGNKVNIDDEGNFQFNIDLFKTGGGDKESKRLGVPLLGKIPISKTLMESTDMGEPLIINNNKHQISKIYMDMTTQILSIVNK